MPLILKKTRIKNCPYRPEDFMPTILITGSNRGIGLEMTRQYLTEGWKVLACCRDIEKSTALNQLKQQHPTQLTIATLDVRDADRIQSLSQEWRTESIDILLNNAGINEPWNLVS
jgi:NAD(P)-dependent dehydrogenase (short-subunit alcohol dehydrogenase family)